MNRSDDRVVAQPVDAAWRCESCGERFTSKLNLSVHDCPAAEPPEGHEWQCPACGATTRARMADHTEPPEGLREAVARWLFEWSEECDTNAAADALLTGPLAPLLAQAATDRAAVERCEKLLPMFQYVLLSERESGVVGERTTAFNDAAALLRRALSGDAR